MVHVGVSKNSGTPKSSILIGFSIIKHPFWGVSPPLFLGQHPCHIPGKIWLVVILGHGIHEAIVMPIGSTKKLPVFEAHTKTSPQMVVVKSKGNGNPRKFQGNRVVGEILFHLAGYIEPRVS